LPQILVDGELYTVKRRLEANSLLAKIHLQKVTGLKLAELRDLINGDSDTVRIPGVDIEVDKEIAVEAITLCMTMANAGRLLTWEEVLTLEVDEWILNAQEQREADEAEAKRREEEGPTTAGTSPADSAPAPAERKQSTRSSRASTATSRGSKTRSTPASS